MNFRTAPLLEAKASRELERVERYGPRPVNIFTSLRQSRALTLEDLSRLAHVGKQAQIRNEQGTFVRPLPAMVEYWVRHHGVSELQITDAYESYQREIRKRHHLLFGPLLVVSTEPGTQHPLRQLRLPLGINTTELSKSLCVPQATLAHFERKFKSQQSVPKELQLALEEVGYSRLLVARFMVDYKDWRAHNVTTLKVM